jgi:uncharacterized membrane protein YfcA
MEYIGFLLALVIGIVLGLLGGGGSILAVPVLAYLFMLDEKVSTAYSLFIVGISALVGGIKQHKSGLVDWKTAIIFGIPAVIGVWLTRHFVVPQLPDVLFEVSSFQFTRRMGMFGLFSLLMFWAAFSMLQVKTYQSDREGVHFNYLVILIEGLVVGGLTGLVGSGGGFLIIPALVVLSNLEIRKAVGTSLIIIAFKSTLGFLLGDALTMTIDWPFLLSFTALTVTGIFIGVSLGQFIDGNKLKTGFAYFVGVMAVMIFCLEFFITH